MKSMGFLFLKVPYEAARLIEDNDVPGEKAAVAEMHITLLYMGKGLSIIDTAKAMVASFEIVSTQTPFLLSVHQISSFPANPDDGVPIICKLNSPELTAFRAKLAEQFDKLGLNYSKKFPDYKPHVTLSYVKEPEKQNLVYSSVLRQPASWVVSEMHIWGGDKNEGSASIIMPFSSQKLINIASRIAGVASYYEHPQVELVIPDGSKVGINR